MSLSYEYQKAILQPEWKSRSNQIKKRDDYTCQKCHENTGVLHVHHKYYVFGRQPWEYPDSALTTLCNHCHSEAHLTKPREYMEGDLELLKLESPTTYQYKLKEIEEEKRQREAEYKKQEMLRQEEFRRQERIRQEKKENQFTFLDIILLPFVLIVSLLLFLGRTFAISIGSVGGGFALMFLLDKTETLGSVKGILVIATIIILFIGLNRVIPKSPFDED